MRYIESYKKVLLSLSLFTKITTFLIFVVFLLEVSQDVFAYLFYSDNSWIRESLMLTAINDGFLVIISGIFILRFIFLWSRKSKSIWFSQLFWLSGWLVIFAYRWITANYWGDLHGDVSIITEKFVGSSVITAQILFIYFYLSPIKQILLIPTAIFSENISRYEK